MILNRTLRIATAAERLFESVAAGIVAAVVGGILPPGKNLRWAKRLGLIKVSSVATPIRRAGSHGSTSAKMADATITLTPR